MIFSRVYFCTQLRVRAIMYHYVVSGEGECGVMTVDIHRLISAHLVGGHGFINAHHTFGDIEIRLILHDIGRGIVVIVSAPVAERERVEVL